jgi:hypothetical protein
LAFDRLKDTSVVVGKAFDCECVWGRCRQRQLELYIWHVLDAIRTIAEFRV